MGRIWERTNRDWRAFKKAVHLGMTVYSIVDVATNIAPYEDPKLYTDHTFTWTHPLLGGLMSGHESAHHVLFNYGPLYEEPPAGIRSIATPGPQVAGPLPKGYKGVLDDAELRSLEKQVADGSNPKKRGRLGGWRV